MSSEVSPWSALLGCSSAIASVCEGSWHFPVIPPQTWKDPPAPCRGLLSAAYTPAQAAAWEAQLQEAWAEIKPSSTCWRTGTPTRNLLTETHVRRSWVSAALLTLRAWELDHAEAPPRSHQEVLDVRRQRNMAGTGSRETKREQVGWG